jgi:transcriptional regulator with XRE-family HTH domain
MHYNVPFSAVIELNGGGEDMELEFIRHRITELRLKKGVSESRMSSDLGHNKNYIQHITSGKSNPSAQELLYIIDYLGVTPSIFFDEGETNPILAQKIIDGLKEMPEADLLLLISFINRLKEGKA